MKCFKGFDKNLTCRDFQYEIGKTYVTDNAELCQEGFHACTNPHDVFAYYNPAESRFCEVELDGIVKGKSDDSKQAGTKITIIREIDIIEYNQLCAEYTKAHAKSKEHQTKDYSVVSNSGYYSSASNSGDCSSASNSGYCSSASNSGAYSSASNSGNCSLASNSGYCSSASNSGDRSSASNSGDCSLASNSGDCSSASNSGKQCLASTVGSSSQAIVSGSQSLAVAFGPYSKAKGALGDFLTLSEWEDDEIINCRTRKIDGKHIKANTFYKMINGKFVEVK